MQAILTLLESLQQMHLAQDLDTLSLDKKQAFLNEISYYAPLLKEQQATLKKPIPSFNLQPLSSYNLSGNQDNINYGKELLSQGKMGVLILAGGQGTRLSSTKPKALFPITLIKHKTLLQFFCEKVHAACLQSNSYLPVAIMTSTLNHQEILSFLKENNFFGLKDSQVTLFSQESLPFLDSSGNFLLESPGKLATGPDGNGHSLKLFAASSISEKWQKEGVQFVNMIPIDNPLADPFDAELLAAIAKSQADVCIKAVKRLDAQEKVGILGVNQNKICIQEYSEHPQDTSSFMIGNIGLFCFSLSFVDQIAQISLPLHLAQKKATLLSKSQLIWKFERFIFDVLPYAHKTEALVYPREDVYAPIKNASGDKSLVTAQKALLAFDRRTYEKISDLSAPEHLFELSPTFYYPTQELLQKWKGRAISSESYID